jgi:hypothetical protein
VTIAHVPLLAALAPVIVTQPSATEKLAEVKIASEPLLVIAVIENNDTVRSIRIGILFLKLGK